jgi:hypothetical protein
MTQSGRLNGESGCIPSSISRESLLITRSLSLWLRVSSEYPSSNLFALIEDAGRKGCMYGGPENWAAELASGPAMVARAGDARSCGWMCGFGCGGGGAFVVMWECAEGVRAWSWTVGCSPNVAWRGSDSSHAGICGTARDYTREQPKESERR